MSWTVLCKPWAGPLLWPLWRKTKHLHVGEVPTLPVVFWTLRGSQLWSHYKEYVKMNFKNDCKGRCFDMCSNMLYWKSLDKNLKFSYTNYTHYLSANLRCQSWYLAPYTDYKWHTDLVAIRSSIKKQRPSLFSLISKGEIFCELIDWTVEY